MEKFCLTCNKRLTRKNKSGFCNEHRNRSGENNPFYGKHHNKETIDNIKIKCSEKSKKLWENNTYKQKVIKGASKPRKESFKKEQSQRITQWYIDNPEQKDIRSVHMSNSWKKGKITKNNYSINSSKGEKQLFEDLKEIYPFINFNYTINIDNKWYFPDIFIKDSHIIIEYFGDYWHANPDKYKANDIVHHNITAKEIWNKDYRRIKKLEQKYHVIIVWESEYKKFKEKILEDLNYTLNWELLDV